MTSVEPMDLEGRLNAQRQLLAALLAWAESRGEDIEALLAPLIDTETIHDHQEDPGAVPTAAFAIEGAREREMRMILEEAQAIIEERKRAS